MAAASTTDQATAALAVARWTAIIAAFVNLGIHLALTPMHLDEMPYIGVLFVIGSALLGTVMVGLASDRDAMRTPAWVGGSLVCAVEFILFIISRTSGLPMGYHETWTGACEDPLGIASLCIEIVFIGCAVRSLTHEAHDKTRSPLIAWIPWRDRTAPLD